QLRRIANVAFHHAQSRVVLRQKVVSEVHDVIDRDAVSPREELRHQTTADVAGSARHEYRIKKPFRHWFPFDHRVSRECRAVIRTTGATCRSSAGRPLKS